MVEVDTAAKVARVTHVGLLGTSYDASIPSHRVTLEQALDHVISSMTPGKMNELRALLAPVGGDVRQPLRELAIRALVGPREFSLNN